VVSPTSKKPNIVMCNAIMRYIIVIADSHQNHYYKAIISGCLEFFLNPLSFKTEFDEGRNSENRTKILNLMEKYVEI